MPEIKGVRDEIKTLLGIGSRIFAITKNLKEHVGRLPAALSNRTPGANRTLGGIVPGQSFMNSPNVDAIIQRAYKLDDFLRVVDGKIASLRNNL